MYFCDVCPVHRIYFAICTIYELSSALAKNGALLELASRTYAS